jgi:hypothetical protein
MAEKGHKNDRKIACFWDDFEQVSLTPPRHVGSERLPMRVPTAKSQF